MTHVNKDSDILRVHIKKDEANLHQNCGVMIDQIRAIGNKRLVKTLGELPKKLVDLVKEDLMIVIDLP